MGVVTPTQKETITTHTRTVTIQQHAGFQKTSDNGKKKNVLSSVLKLPVQDGFKSEGEELETLA